MDGGKGIENWTMDEWLSLFHDLDYKKEHFFVFVVGVLNWIHSIATGLFTLFYQINKVPSKHSTDLYHRPKKIIKMNLNEKREEEKKSENVVFPSFNSHFTSTVIQSPKSQSKFWKLW